MAKFKAAAVALEELSAAKKKKKSEIQQWVAAFQDERGHAPSNEEKEPIKQHYMQYKALEAKVKADKQVIDRMTTELDSARAELAILKPAVTDAAPTPADASAAPAASVDQPEARESAAPEVVAQLRGQVAASQAQLGEIGATTAPAAGAAVPTVATPPAAANEAQDGEPAADASERVEKLEAQLQASQSEQSRLKAEVNKLNAEAARVAAIPPANADERERAAHLERVHGELRQALEAVAKADDEVEATFAERKSLRKEVETLQERLEESHGKEGALRAELETAREGASSIARALAQAEERAEVTSALLAAQSEALAKAPAPAAPVAPAAEEQQAAAAEPNASEEVYAQIATDMKRAVIEGTSLWKANSRVECFQLYLKTANKAISRLPDDAQRHAIEAAARTSQNQAPARGAVTLRKAFDAFLAAATEVQAKAKAPSKVPATPAAPTTAPEGPPAVDPKVAALQQKLRELEAGTSERGVARAGPGSASEDAPGELRDALRRAEDAEQELDALRVELDEIRAKGSPSGGGAPSSPTAASASAAPPARARAAGASQTKVRELEKKARDDAATIRKLQEKVASAETAAASSDARGDKSGEKAAKASKKAMDDAQKKWEAEKSKLTARIEKASKEMDDGKAQLAAMTSERDALKKKASALDNMGKEMERLQQRANDAEQLEKDVAALNQSNATLEKQYKEEMTLRKKYWNTIEDMKGKIRVYARCRPFAKYEIERGCSPVVRFADDTTLELNTAHGLKEFAFDAVFDPESTQGAVFEDTRNLIQSCLDGYNVCIFAYGQTGSGKTFTMTGSDSLPGLTPRAITELFDGIANTKTSETKVTAYFVELYNDQVVDLLWKLENRTAKGDGPKLDIKVDSKKMVFVKNVTTKSVGSPSDLMELFNAGNGMRHVGATKMNAESSRSHSIFSILVESYNTTTKKTSVGKLSLVDLAGSERADKTGATAERLKEAQSINKSLSALGDVISALSNNEKFIPYRNNKLTQLMQDSLGGNAKTLMFVNISPADYNRDETLTSLLYASRVKLITNDAAKTVENEEIKRLKDMIRELKAGRDVEVD